MRAQFVQFLWFFNNLIVCFGCFIAIANGAISEDTMKKIDLINNEGPYLGIVVPNSFEMDPLLQSSRYVANVDLPYLDFAGRRFRLGKVENKSVIIVMTGLAMLNAGVATQLLLSLFNVRGVVHYGIAGNANPALHIGDVTIPRYWAHSGLWNWQRYGDGPQNELSLEANGDYTRKIGYLDISEFNIKSNNASSQVNSYNTLNNVWYQAEEIFPLSGTPEERQHAFWVPVDKNYFRVAKKLEGLKLERCVNSTECLPKTPVAVRVERGLSANVYLDNKAYREFLNSKFNATPIDMESAAVALICHQQNVPFIVIRSLSDLAGGGSAESNEADVFAPLASQNSVTALIKFISLL